jgi:tetratricopeptide (TPR) repeat protein
MLFIVLVFQFRRAQALTERDSILLADFVNTTGDPVFDGTLKQALGVQLAQSPFLNILPEPRVRETLRYMGRSPDDRLTSEVARELCQRAGIKAMLTGSIASLGSHYVLSLNAMNCRTGDSLAQEQVEAESKEGVLQAMGRAASSLRGRLGESLNSIQKLDAPIEQATTPSLEALQAFSLGEAQRGKGDELQSIPFYKRAIELDPNFAMAYGKLGAVYSNMYEGELSRSHFKEAFARRDRVTELEKLYITARYYDAVTGEMEKAVETYELWKQTYPRDWTPYNNLSVMYSRLGQPDKALENALQTLRMVPDSAFPYINAGAGYVDLNRFGEAKAIFQQAHARKLDSVAIHELLYRIAFIQGDPSEMERQIEWTRGKPEEAIGLAWQAGVAAFGGQLEKAGELRRRASQALQRLNLKAAAAGLEIGQAGANAMVGNCRKVREQMSSALAVSREPYLVLGAAGALALCGETRQAQALADEVARQFPANTLLNAVWLPTARAAIELNRGNPAKTIEMLQTAAPYERGKVIVPFLRGLAYLRLRAGVQAATEFQKILDQKGWAGADMLFPLTHLGLARAYGLAGDTGKSRKFYQDFFALWKDADPDTPVLQEAKTEYARLK